MNFSNRIRKRTWQGIAVLAHLFVILSVADGQMNFWLSTASTAAEGSAPGGIPNVQVPRGSTGHIYIWAQPDANKTLESFSLNLVSTSETAIEFTSAEVVNDGRFGAVFDTSTPDGLDITDQTICVFPAPLHGVWGLSGFSIDPVSGTGLNAASPGGDAHYDAKNESWLLASIGYSALANGNTDLFLEIGQIGMNYAGESAESMTVRFGSLADPPLGNAFEDRCEPSATREAFLTVVDPLLGDFNANGTLDAPDIDLLSAEVRAGTNTPSFNLTGAATVDQADRQYWVETLKGTNFGDADLNGLVDFADFLRLSGSFGQSLGWSDGDTDGNQLIDFADFLALSGNFGEGTLLGESQVVPEPGFSAWWVLIGIFYGRLVTRRRSLVGLR